MRDEGGEDLSASCSLYDEVSAKGQPSRCLSAEFPCPPTPICSWTTKRTADLLSLFSTRDGRSGLVAYRSWLMCSVSRPSLTFQVFTFQNFRRGRQRPTRPDAYGIAMHHLRSPAHRSRGGRLRKTDAVHSTDHRVRVPPQWTACTQCAAIQPASAARGGLPHSGTASHVPPHDWPTRTGWPSERTTPVHPVIPPGLPDDLSIVDKPSMDRDVDRPSIFRRRIASITHR